MKILSRTANHRTLARHDAREQNFRGANPRTDYDFRPATNDVAVANRPAAGKSASDLRAFRRMSQELLNEEDRRNYVLEILVLGLVIAIAAWPLISLLVVLAQTASG